MSVLRRGLPAGGLRTAGRSDRTAGDHRPAPVPQCLWRLVDGIPGHDNQSLGLVRALQRSLPLEVHDIPVGHRRLRPGPLLRRRFPAGDLLPDPWLLVGAGHATHVPLLQARRARGGRAVVIMSPSLPRRWFDLCVIPAHDAPAPAANVLVTRGSLTTVERHHDREKLHGMILVGGPSRHHRWSHTAVRDQILRVIRFSPVRRWLLTTSRRTPPGFARHIRQWLPGTGRELTVTSWQDTAGDWLGEQLSRAVCAWVTADSVSMVYEALTAGVPVGLLELPVRRRSRVVHGVQQLVTEGQVMPFGAWAGGRPLSAPVASFDAAGHAAQWICAHWGP